MVNDLSFEGQFRDLSTFYDAVGRLMKIRQIIGQSGSSFYCHRRLAQVRVTPDALMQQAIQGLSRSKQRAWMQWITRHGPHWEDDPAHGPDDYLWVDDSRVADDPVTDTAVGEAAVCLSRGIERELISLDPSQWLFTPVDVKWVHEDEVVENILVSNHWNLASIRKSLERNPAPIDSWKRLDAQVRRSCPHLFFVDGAFRALEGHPFVSGAAVRIRVLLQILNRFKGCFDEEGRRTEEGHRLYANFFSGGKAWFSDSSDSEKREFFNDLQFPHPEKPKQSLLCTWHGKIKTPQIRIHFSWPVRASEALYIVYVGPKITKR